MDVLVKLKDDGQHVNIRRSPEGRLCVIDCLMYLNNCHEASPQNSVATAVACFERIKPFSKAFIDNIMYFKFPGHARLPLPVADISTIKQILSLRLQKARFPFDLKQRLVQTLHLPVTVPMNTYIEEEVMPRIFRSLHVFEPHLRYPVGPYVIDMYLPRHKLAVECDENGHQTYDKHLEERRTEYIKSTLGCCIFRFDPYSETFDIFDVIAQLLHIIYSKNPPTFQVAAEVHVPKESKGKAHVPRPGSKSNEQSRSFSDIQPMSQEQFQSLGRAKAPDQMRLAAKKFAFVNYVIRDFDISEADQATLFEHYFAPVNGRFIHRTWLCFAFQFCRTEAFTLMENDLVQINCLKFERLEKKVLNHIQIICESLGLQNVHDTERTLTRHDFQNSMNKITPSLKFLRDLYKPNNVVKQYDLRTVIDTLRFLFRELFGMTFVNEAKDQKVKCQAEEGPRQHKAISYSLVYADAFSRCLYTSGLI